MAIADTKMIYEIFELVEKAKTRQDKIDVLKKHETWGLKDVLRGTFDESIKWLLPEGRPPFNANDGHNAPSNLLKQNGKFKYFVSGAGYNNMMPIKREVMFIGMLESIHPKDAEVALCMIAKKSPAKGLTKKLVQEAFPGLILK